MTEKLKILYVASEVEPFVKTGGLADVAGSLPQKIKKMGHDIRVVLPEFEQIPDKYRKEAEHVTDFNTDVAWRSEYVGINKLNHQGVPTYFVDNKRFFDRSWLYDNDDKHLQFTYFSKAVLDLIKKIDFKPDIIHCNDWQTGPIMLLLEDQYRQSKFYRDIKTIFTIHNLSYQGMFDHYIIDDVLGVDHWHWEIGTIRHNGLVNFMKMGIMYTDLINTVSNTYAEEIKHPYFGEGLDYALRLRGEDLTGILNGISYEKFNPATDNRIYENYNQEDFKDKYKNKMRLQEEMNLPVKKGIPLIGVISRLVEPKGFDLVMEVFEELIQEKLQFVILGTGERKYEDFFRLMADKYPDKIAVRIEYDSGLAQKIYAGSDIFLMPSRFEPCGLSQLISLRYGTIPVVRETGGLKDTVVPYNPVDSSGYGFTFKTFNAHDMLYAIKRACYYFNNKETWYRLIKRAMCQEFSWRRSAEKYINLYNKLC